jgi:photosystem II Psb27 protein
MAAMSASSQLLSSDFLPVSKAVSRPTSSPCIAPRCGVRVVASSEGSISRREAAVASAAALLGAALFPLPALADFEESYQSETKNVIEKVRYTLNLDREDPNRSDAVTQLRELSNEWVAKYRREKSIAGRPSFSNMYSVLNAISGHYISFGPTYPIPKKRQDRIFEEVDIAEKALARGR